MPTGVAIRDPRGQLFDAAERVLLRDGPGALTSRAVTAEAGVAKGVLHRHFADFDAFLAELALDRIAQDRPPWRRRCAPRRGPAPSPATWPPRSPRLFSPAVLALDPPGHRARRAARPAARRHRLAHPPRLRVHGAWSRGYLAAERDLGRIAADADIGTLAPTLIGAAHLLFADADGPPPDAAAVTRVVTTVLASVTT